MKKALLKFPGACRRCCGEGEYFSNLQDLENFSTVYCPDCLAQGLCPRCREVLPKNWKRYLETFERTMKFTTGPRCRGKKCRWKYGDLPVLPVTD